MDKLDLRKLYKHLYQPPATEVQVVDVPELSYLMIDGAIEQGQQPGTSPEFANTMQALYGAAFTLKFMSKKRAVDPIDYGVMAIEGLWTITAGDFDINKKDNWAFRLLMLQPEHITPEMFADALTQLRKKHPENTAVDRLHLERWCEGLSMQIMHIGPYAEEMATVARMQAFAAANGYRPRGIHHEIYMGDPRRGDPAKMRTILRQPIEKAV